MKKTKSRSRIRSQLPIPNDWDGQTWATVMICVPDSPLWKASVSGQLYELSKARLWERETGVILDAAEIGRQIFESVDMNCTELTRIADGIEALCDKVPDPVSLQDFLNDMIANRDGGSPVEGIANWIDLFLRLNELFGLIPNIDIRIDPTNLARLALEGFSAYNTAKFRQDTLQLQKAALLKQGGPDVGTIVQEIINVIPYGNLVDTFTDIDETVLTIASSIINLLTGNYVTNRLAEIRDKIDEGNTLLQALTELGIDTSEIATAINNLDLDAAFNGDNTGESEDMTTVINQYFGCSCDGVCSCGAKTTTTTPTPTDTPTNISNPDPLAGPVNQNPPPGFDAWQNYLQHKCNAAHHIYAQIHDVVAQSDSWITALLSGGISDVVNLIAGVGYYWMTSETLTAFATNLFNWVLLGDAPPTFWSQYAANIQSAKDLIICTMYEAVDTAQVITDTTSLLTDIAETTLIQNGLTLGSSTGAAVVSSMTNIVNPALMNDLFQSSSNIPATPQQTCSCASEPGPNTGVCYAMNTNGGNGMAQLLSDDGSTQVWRVTPAFSNGLYKMDLQAFDTSDVQIAYQVTNVVGNNTAGVTFSQEVYTYEDASQSSSFSPGCLDSIVYESADPGWSFDVSIDLTQMNNCAGCTSAPVPPSSLPIAWNFDTDAEGWTFTDQSAPTPANSASMAWEASTQALRNSHDVAGGSSQSSAILVTSPLLNVPSDGNQRVVVNRSAPSDGLVVSRQIYIHFASAPDEFHNYSASSNAIETIANIATVDTITGVSVFTARSTGGGNGPWTFTIDIEDVTLEDAP